MNKDLVFVFGCEFRVNNSFTNTVKAKSLVEAFDKHVELLKSNLNIEITDSRSFYEKALVNSVEVFDFEAGKEVVYIIMNTYKYDDFKSLSDHLLNNDEQEIEGGTIFLGKICEHRLTPENSTVIERFNANKDKFKWFIEEYFPNKFIILEEMAKDGKGVELLAELNNIWFFLPDNIFNILNMPKGWGEFLNVVEV